jgi:hypothetical protein
MMNGIVLDAKVWEDLCAIDHKTAYLLNGNVMAYRIVLIKKMKQDQLAGLATKPLILNVQTQMTVAFF